VNPSSAYVTFFRIGEAPGSQIRMDPAPWPRCSTPQSDGMNPLYHEYYRDDVGRLKCGVWECSAGNIELCNSSADRVCFILRGTLRLTDSQKHSATFGAGECLVIPRAFSGVWSQSEDFAMAYALFDEGDEARSR
jgi:uncharacterized protein